MGLRKTLSLHKHSHLQKFIVAHFRAKTHGPPPTTPQCRRRKSIKIEPKMTEIQPNFAKIANTLFFRATFKIGKIWHFSNNGHVKFKNIAIFGNLLILPVITCYCGTEELIARAKACAIGNVYGCHILG